MKDVHDFLVAEFRVPGGRLGTDENLLGGILDSMGLLRLVSHLEETYGFEVGENDLVPENFSTLERIRDYVERRRGV